MFRPYFFQCRSRHSVLRWFYCSCNIDQTTQGAGTAFSRIAINEREWNALYFIAMTNFDLFVSLWGLGNGGFFNTVAGPLCSSISGFRNGNGSVNRGLGGRNFGGCCHYDFFRCSVFRRSSLERDGQIHNFGVVLLNGFCKIPRVKFEENRLQNRWERTKIKKIKVSALTQRIYAKVPK